MITDITPQPMFIQMLRLGYRGKTGRRGSLEHPQNHEGYCVCWGNCVLLLLFYKRNNVKGYQQGVPGPERTGAPRDTTEDRNYNYLKQ